jgi:hypothetical protein
LALPPQFGTDGVMVNKTGSTLESVQINIVGRPRGEYLVYLWLVNGSLMDHTKSSTVSVIYEEIPDTTPPTIDLLPLTGATLRKLDQIRASFWILKVD